MGRNHPRRIICRRQRKSYQQDLCEIRRQVTRYIDEIETYDSNVGERSIFHQLYKDMMTDFLAYVTYLQLKYRAL